MTSTNEVTPLTASKANKLESLLLEAQELANELVVNDKLKVLRIENQNISHRIMKIRHAVIDYEEYIRDAIRVTS